MWPFRRRPQVRAVFFDVGGVLVQADLERYLVYGAEIFGCAPEQVQDAARGLVVELETGRINSLQFWESLGRALGRSVPTRKFEGFWGGLLRDTVKVDRPMLELAARVARRTKIGVLSNTFDEHAAHFRKLGVYQPFPVLILSYQVGLRKPERGIYQLAAKMMRLSPSNCLLVDDSLVNVEGARAAGMRAHHFVDHGDLVADLGGHGLL